MQPRSFFALGGFLALSLPASAGRPGTPELPFPFRVAGVGAESVRLVPDGDLLALVARETALVVVDVPVPPVTGGPPATLELVRLHGALERSVLHVDGAPAPWIEADPRASHWTGRVRGEPGSRVYLGLSSLGSRGWIRRASGFVHLLAAPGPDGTWERSEARLVAESSLAALGARPTGGCASIATSAGAGSHVAWTGLAGGSGTSALGTSHALEVTLAIETDTQFHALFGSTAAAAIYVEQLLAAARLTYLEEAHVVLTPVHVGFHPTADTWNTPDVGGSPAQLVVEFENAWQAAIPGNAHLAHFLSGANLGGGAAYVTYPCGPFGPFAASTSLSGATPFPPAQGPLTWDFVSFAHETAHNLGAIHTHQFCPPLDDCAPPGLFGTCQTQQVCTSSGTLMSYCHLCAGGTDNIDLHFHPASAAQIRAGAEIACGVEPYAPGTPFCAGDGLDAAVTVPCPCANFGDPGHGCGNSVHAAGALLQGFDTTDLDDAVLVLSQLPSTTTVIFIRGSGVLPAGQVLGDGIFCLDGTLRRFGLQNAVNGLASYPGPTDNPLSVVSQTTHGSGVTLGYQAYYRNASASWCPPATYNLANAYRITW